MREVVTLICFILLTSSFILRAQTYSINRSTIDGGSGTSTGGVFAISGTVGLPDAGKLSGGDYAINGGFWGLIAAVQMPGAPLLTITHSGTNAIVSWPSPSTGFVLQQNTSNVSNTNGWSNFGGTVNDSGTLKSTTVPISLGNKFFRLKN